MKWPDCRFFNVEKCTILAGYMGSHSHGTYIPPKKGGIDDKDIMGICIPPKRFYLGLEKFEQIDVWVEEYDIVIYEFRKFINLLLKNNPNVMGLLWIAENLYVKRTPLGDLLIENRDIFSSKLAYKSFTGYAYSQLDKMEKWEHKGFLGDKRKALVEKFGYDTKNAAHLIRLLRMGIEFLSTGHLNVFREDAQQLIAIKKGEYTLEKIKEMAEDLFKVSQQAFLLSKLPENPDIKKAEKILIKGIEDNILGNNE